AAPASGNLCRGDACLQRRGGHAAHAVLDAPVPDPALRLPHPRPRLGDAGEGPLRPGRSLTPTLPDGSAQLLDAEQVARGIADGAVANPVGLLGRLLDDLGVARLQPLEGAVEVGG